MSDHRDALWKIANMCMESRSQTKRITMIHLAAMRALGMTENQRTERLEQAENGKRTHIQSRRDRRSTDAPSVQHFEDGSSGSDVYSHWNGGRQPEETIGKQVQILHRNGDTTPSISADSLFWGNISATYDLNIVGYCVL